jgi:putative transcriptional regulator
MPMTKYHPETRFLTDYAAGGLPRSQALCVSAHLHYCQSCQRKLAQLNQLGSVMLDELAPMEPKQGFSSLMEKIDALSESPPQKSSTSGKASFLPAVLQKLTRGNLESLQWHTIGKYFSYSDLDVGDHLRETSLFSIKAGGNVPRHKHKGDEITVVLKGSFSDQDDHYQAGDFIVRTRGEIHRPVAAQDEDCLCLSTLEAPIQMTNWFYRLLMPFAKAAAHPH